MERSSRKITTENSFRYGGIFEVQLSEVGRMKEGLKGRSKASGKVGPKGTEIEV